MRRFGDGEANSDKPVAEIFADGKIGRVMVLLVMRLANEFSPTEIEVPRVRVAVAEVLQKRDALTRKAAETLKALGVTEDDLAELMAQCVRR